MTVPDRVLFPRIHFRVMIKHCALGHGAKNPIVNGIGNLETFESYRVCVVIFPSEKALKPALGRREYDLRILRSR